MPINRHLLKYLEQQIGKLLKLKVSHNYKDLIVFELTL
jgi:hypothetical protein